MTAHMRKIQGLVCERQPLCYWGFRKNLQAILVTFFSFSFHQTYLDPYMDGKLMSLRVS